MHRRWLSLPLLSSCVSAFYPYNDGVAEEKRGSPSQRSEQEEGDLLKLDLHKVERRNNAFPVLLSNTPSNPNAVAIDQDGSDYSYFSSFKFGSSAQPMYMLIDTGSANTWVFSSECQSESCQIHNTFGSADSTTLKTTSTTWDLAYGTGQVEGVVGSDTVAFADFSISLGFGLATNASDDFNNYPMDGILGLGRATSNQLGTPTVMQALQNQTKIKSNVIGVHLNRAADNTKEGEILFGGIDTSKFSGELNYVKATNVESWEVDVDDVSVNGSPLNFQGKSAVIDTGTTYILMPPTDAKLFHSQISGSVQTNETYTVPCNTDAKVTVTIGGKSYGISPKDYVGKSSGSACSSNVIGHQAFGANEWILGDVFLKNVYAVFDFDASRIGFGMPGSGGTVPSSSSTSSASSASGTSSPSESTTSSPSTTTGSSSSATASSSSTSDGSPFSTGSGKHNSASALEYSGILLATFAAFVIGLTL